MLETGVRDRVVSRAQIWRVRSSTKPRFSFGVFGIGTEEGIGSITALPQIFVWLGIVHAVITQNPGGPIVCSTLSN